MTAALVSMGVSVEDMRWCSGIMGVPITFLDKYNPEQFEIVDARDCTENDKCKKKTTMLIKDADAAINGKPTYARICIRPKH